MQIGVTWTDILAIASEPYIPEVFRPCAAESQYSFRTDPRCGWNPLLPTRTPKSKLAEGRCLIVIAAAEGPGILAATKALGELRLVLQRLEMRLRERVVV
jgi:hypothetical protein